MNEETEINSKAEVNEENKPNRRDFLAISTWAIGGVITLDFYPDVRMERIDADLKTFVLGDSGEPKDTKTILGRVKEGVIDIIGWLRNKHPVFSIHDATRESIRSYASDLSEEQFSLLNGTVENHRITQKAKELLQQKSLDHHQIGKFLNAHQQILRDILKISTPKIDRMLEAAMDAGAYGGKINGSGGGGCMFAYAPENPEKVLKSIEKVGGKGYIVRLDWGTRVEKQ